MVDEILEHEPSNVRLGRLNTGGALLENHDMDRQIGCVDKAEVRGGKGYAVVRFSKSAAGQAALEDVRDGIRRNVSVGYRTHRVTPGNVRNSRKEMRVVDWEPYEISLVSVPADPTVGVGRKNDLGEYEVRIETSMSGNLNKPDSQPQAPPSVEVLAEHSKRAIAEERKRVGEIAAIGRLHDVSEAAEKAIVDGTSLDAFRSWLLDTKLKAQKVTSTAPTLETMEKSAKRRYSLSNLIAGLTSERGHISGFEAEVAQELFKGRGGRKVDGVLVPLAVLGIQSRANNATTGSAGGYTIDEDFMGSEFIKKLDNPTVVESAGARRLTGLMGDVVIPTQTGGATAYWLAETASVTDSELTFGQLKLAPHRLSVSVPWTRQLAIQSSMDVEGLIREDANKRINLAIDKAAFQGLGAAGEPKGLFSYDTTNSGINTVTYSGAATHDKAVEQIGALLTDNSLALGSPTYVISPASWAKWASKFIDTGSGKRLFEGPADNGMVSSGYRGIVSQHLPSEKSVCGIFSEMLLGYWEGVDVIVDPYTQKKTGIIEILFATHVDIAVRYPEAFVVSTDTAAA